MTAFIWTYSTSFDLFMIKWTTRQLLEPTLNIVTGYKSTALHFQLAEHGQRADFYIAKGVA
jgi:hypothetical protein